jgi:SAM-dependent methyltransferase
MLGMIVEWFRTDRHQADRGAPLRVFLCGVTPEIVTMDWPFPVDLTGMDQAESMVRLVWPGDRPGVRRGLVGSWLESGLTAGSQDVVIGDGGFVFFAFPGAQKALMAELRRVLAPGGLFVYRHYAQADRRESLDEVLGAARSGSIGNFHVFKWRLAMALQQDSPAGVRQHDIWTAWSRAEIDATKLPQPGWSARAVGTIHFYRDKQARLYFPTLGEFTGLLEERYEDIEVRIPGYELGERCPVIAARPRV